MDWVNEKLDCDGWFTAEKIQAREGASVKRRRRIANDIVDTWAEEGKVKALYEGTKLDACLSPICISSKCSRRHEF